MSKLSYPQGRAGNVRRGSLMYSWSAPGYTASLKGGGPTPELWLSLGTKNHVSEADL